jgi:hypothetical protein
LLLEREHSAPLLPTHSYWLGFNCSVHTHCEQKADTVVVGIATYKAPATIKQLTIRNGVIIIFSDSGWLGLFIGGAIGPRRSYSSRSSVEGGRSGLSSLPSAFGSFTWRPCVTAILTVVGSATGSACTTWGRIRALILASVPTACLARRHEQGW